VLFVCNIIIYEDKQFETNTTNDHLGQFYFSFMSSKKIFMSKILLSGN